MELRFDERGLIPAIAQDRLTGEVRMLAWMNEEALAQTLKTGLATFYSRSRAQLWTKGEQSGNHLRVAEVVADCDQDALLLLVDPVGPTCHTGRQSCFFNQASEAGGESDAAPLLDRLDRLVERRASESAAEPSYTRTLLAGGSERIAAKLSEEAAELGYALARESDQRVAEEAADLLFHLLVGLRQRGMGLRPVIEVLARRFGIGGHTEKASRKKDVK